jgi:hypothetical protein
MNVTQRPNWHLDALLSKLTMKIVSQFNMERMSGESVERSIARAVYDQLNGSIMLLNMRNQTERHLPEKYLANEDYLEHVRKQTFYKFSDELYKTDNFMLHEWTNGFQKNFDYTIAVFKVKD